MIPDARPTSTPAPAGERHFDMFLPPFRASCLRCALCLEMQLLVAKVLKEYCRDHLAQGRVG